MTLVEAYGGCQVLLCIEVQAGIAVQSCVFFEGFEERFGNALFAASGAYV